MGVKHKEAGIVINNASTIPQKAMIIVIMMIAVTMFQGSTIM
jgi:hypothetical protein